MTTTNTVEPLLYDQHNQSSLYVTGHKPRLFAPVKAATDTTCSCKPSWIHTPVAVDHFVSTSLVTDPAAGWGGGTKHEICTVGHLLVTYFYRLGGGIKGATHPPSLHHIHYWPCIIARQGGDRPMEGQTRLILSLTWLNHGSWKAQLEDEFLAELELWTQSIVKLVVFLSHRTQLTYLLGVSYV